MKETREKSKYQFALDNRQAGLIVSGLLLVLVLSFLMGALFGRNMSRMTEETPAAVAAATANPQDMADLNAMPATPEPAGAAPAAGGASALDTALAGYKSQQLPTLDQLNAGSPAAPAPAALTDAYDTEAPAEARATGATGPLAAPTPLSAPLPTGAPIAEPAPRPAPVREPVARVAAADPEPSAVPRPVIPAGAYTIQIASAPSKGEAQAIVNQLRARKYDAYMLTAALPQGTFYRVRVGHYLDLDQAEKARRILQSREGKYFDAWITQ
jgi:cell division septation protein DedD